MKQTRTLAKYFVVASVIIVAGFFFGSVASAQIVEPTGEQFSINIVPSNPGPNSTVTASVRSFLVDLDAAPITWFINDVRQVSGIGVKDFSFETGPVGSSTTVRATVNVPGSSPVSKAYSIRPSTVDILWESVNGYRPPFYKGKILPSKEAKIKAVAVPHISVGGRTVPANELIYTWERDFTVDSGSSGYGKDAFSFINTFINNSERVSVAVSTRDGLGEGGKISVINIYDPEIVVYQTEGNYHNYRVADNAAFREPVVSLIAEPYNFSVNQNDPRVLRYVWKSGNTTLTNPDGTRLLNELAVQTPAEGGRASLGVFVEHPISLFQAANSVINLTFLER